MGIETIAAIASITAATASIGLGAASATGAIGPGKPKDPVALEVPGRGSAAVEEARRRELVAASKMRSPASNYLTSGSDMGAAPVATKYLTGQ